MARFIVVEKYFFQMCVTWSKSICTYDSANFSLRQFGTIKSTEFELTWLASITWFASSVIGNNAPSSDWKEAIGANVPEVKTIERASSLISQKIVAGFRHQKCNEYCHPLTWLVFLRGLNHPPLSAGFKVYHKKYQRLRIFEREKIKRKRYYTTHCFFRKMVTEIFRQDNMIIGSVFVIV